MRDAEHHELSASRAGASPADDLADVWDILDTLPTAKPPADLTATTVELVAARVARDAGSLPAPTRRSIDRALPFAIVAASFVVGIAAGLGTAPDPDQRILERLPIIEHLDLLQEAGSVAFLEALEEQVKSGKGNVFRWKQFVRDPSEFQAESQAFETKIESLRSELVGDNSSRGALSRRRERVARLSASDLVALEKSAAVFEELPAVDRRELERLARALAEPARDSLREAAKRWHVFVTAINPAFRRIIVGMPSADRLEWLVHSVGRLDLRLPPRPRSDDAGDDRRPPAQHLPRGNLGGGRPGNGRWPVPFERPPAEGPPGDRTKEWSDRRPNGGPAGGMSGLQSGAPAPPKPPPRGGP